MHCIFILLFASQAALAEVRFNGEGYEDLLIGLSPELTHDSNATISTLLENLENLVTLGSNALYKATGGLAYINTVTFILPYDWKFDSSEFATSEVYEDSDIKVVSNNCLMSNAPHTFRLGSCGEAGSPSKGDHISLPHNIFNEKKMDDRTQGKTFLNLWAQYRYGVYEEHGFPNDVDLPLIYYEKKNVTTALPNACSNVPLQGEFRNWQTNKTCTHDISTGLFEADCMFHANQSQSDVTSSIMSLAYIDSNEHFCNDTTHNSAAPNRQNIKCQGRSVWSVISDSEDFKNIKPNKMYTSAPPPTFQVLKQSFQQFILLMDVSGSMDGDKIKNMISESEFWIADDYQLKDGSFLGIVSFSSGFNVEHSLTQITNIHSRDEQIRAIADLAAGGTTEIGNALLKSAQLLGERRNGGIILLITDGEESGGYSMTDEFVLNTLKEQKIKVIAMALGESASDKLELLASETGGSVFFIAEDGNGFTDAFDKTTTMQPGSALGRATIVEDSVDRLIYLPNKKVFHVDKSIAKNLRLEIKIPTFRNASSMGKDLIKAHLTSSDGKIYDDLVWSNAHIGHIIVPYVPENLTWNWTIEKTDRTGEEAMSTGIFIVTAERTNDTLPLQIDCFIENRTVSGDNMFAVWAKVTQGNEPVLYTTVRARLESPQTDFTPCERILKDDNPLNDAFSLSNDGIYGDYFDISNYCTDWIIDSSTRFNLICEVVGDEDSYMCETVHRDMLWPSNSEVPYCCGSTIPEPKEKAMTGPFERRSSGGSVKIFPPSNPNPPARPPAKILDLSLEVEITPEKHYQIHMAFTAPGNNFLSGIARSFLIKFSACSILNDDEFEAATTVPNSDIILGSLEAPPPLTSVHLLAAIHNVETYQTLHFAIKTINQEDLSSPISNVPSIFLPSGQPVPVPPPATTSFFSFGLILGTTSRDLAECECPPECEVAQITNCAEESNLACSNSCYCSCQSEKRFGPPFTLSDANPFAMLTMERTWESDKSSHPSCPTCPCEYDLEKTMHNGNSSVQTCTCFCDRISNEKDTKRDVGQDGRIYFEDDALPASMYIELYEYEDIQDNIPQPSCSAGGHSFVYKGCVNDLCMLINTCIVNTFFYKNSNVHFSMKSNVYIIYVNITDNFDDDMCPEQFCEGELAEYCNDDHTKCTFQSVCVCTY